jgi:hypothetical protein
MSAKSIGYTAIALPNGTYTSASIGVNSKGQITQLISNTISPEAEGLTDEYDALVEIIDDSVFIEGQTQNLLKDLSDNLIPDLTSVQAELIEATNDLQTQYDALEAQYLTLNGRFTPTLAVSYTANELDIPNYDVGETQNFSITTFSLPAGKYTWFFNAYGTMRYSPLQVGNPPVATSVNTPSNPLDASQQGAVQGIAGSNFNYNFASQSCSLLANGIIASVIANFDTSDIGTPDSGLGLDSKIDNAVVWGGSNTFVLTEETNAMELKIFLTNFNTSNAILGFINSTIDVNTLAENNVFNMPVVQAGNALEIWKVGS